MQEAAFCSAMYDFTATMDNQISLRAGDKLVAMASELEIEEMDDWVFCRHLHNHTEGYVPSNYLRVESRDDVERALLRDEIARLEHSVDLENKIVSGFEDVMNSAKKRSDKATVMAKIKDSKERIAEMLNHLEHLRGRLGLVEDEDCVEEEDSEDDLPKPPPIKPYTGIVKSIVRTSASPKKPFRIRFDLPDDAEPPLPSPTVSVPARPTAPPPISVAALSAPDTTTTIDLKKNRKARNSLLLRPKAKEPDTVKVSDLSSPEWCGYLWMEHSGLKGWQKRYLVLKDSVLYIFKKPTDKDCLQKIVLPSYAVVPIMGSAGGTSTSGRMWCFKLTHVGCPTLVFSAESKEQLARCVSTFTLATIAAAKSDLFTAQEVKQMRRRSAELSNAQEGLALKALAMMDLDESAQAGGPPPLAPLETALTEPAVSAPAAPQVAAAAPRATAAAAAAQPPPTSSEQPPTASEAAVASLPPGIEDAEPMQADFDYEAAEDNELGFKRGDVLLKTRTLNESWFMAFRESDKAVGMVPSNYFHSVKGAK